MLKRAGKDITEVRLSCYFTHRVIFAEFYRGDKLIGEREMIGDFLTRDSFFNCFQVLGDILSLCGYAKLSNKKTPDSPINNSFVYALPTDRPGLYLKINSEPIQKIIMECQQAARRILIEYYAKDPEHIDHNYLIKIEEDKLEHIQTLIDYEFLAHALHRFFTLIGHYKETEQKCLFNRYFPDCYTFEYQRFVKEPVPT